MDDDSTLTGIPNLDAADSADLLSYADTFEQLRAYCLTRRFGLGGRR